MCKLINFSRVLILFAMFAFFCSNIFCQERVSTGTRGGGDFTIDAKGHPGLKDLLTNTTCDWFEASEIALAFPMLEQILSSIEAQSPYLRFMIEDNITKLDVCKTGELIQIATEDIDGVTVETLDKVQVAIRINSDIYVNWDLLRSSDDKTQGFIFVHEVLHSFIPMDTPQRNNKLRSFVKTLERNFVEKMEHKHFKLQVKKNKIAISQMALDLSKPQVELIKVALNKKEEKTARYKTVYAARDIIGILHPTHSHPISKNYDTLINKIEQGYSDPYGKLDIQFFQEIFKEDLELSGALIGKAIGALSGSMLSEAHEILREILTKKEDSLHINYEKIEPRFVPGDILYVFYKLNPERYISDVDLGYRVDLTDEMYRRNDLQAMIEVGGNVRNGILVSLNNDDLDSAKVFLDNKEYFSQIDNEYYSDLRSKLLQQDDSFDSYRKYVERYGLLDCDRYKYQGRSAYRYGYKTYFHPTSFKTDIGIAIDISEEFLKWILEQTTFCDRREGIALLRKVLTEHKGSASKNAKRYMRRFIRNMK